MLGGMNGEGERTGGEVSVFPSSITSRLDRKRDGLDEIPTSSAENLLRDSDDRHHDVQ